MEVLTRVRRFKTFTPENDPYGEHDFGSLSIEGHKIFWKFDYWDQSQDWSGLDKSDPSKTIRVLTIMLAEEY